MCGIFGFELVKGGRRLRRDQTFRKGVTRCIVLA